jgi:propionyl-CoA synthetase
VVCGQAKDSHGHVTLLSIGARTDAVRFSGNHLPGVRPGATEFPKGSTFVELSWFRRPGAGHGPGAEEGTLNLCYNAVDLPVVRGFASAPALRDGDEELSFEVLLEQVAALAGAMRALGIGPESVVGVLLDDPTDRILMLLACLRLGAVHVELVEPAGDIDRHRPHLVATSRPLAYADHVPAASLVRGIPTEDDHRDLDWEIAARAGRTDPAPCAALAPGSTAYVFVGTEVSIVAAVEDDSWAGRTCATLCAGQTIDLTGDLA